MISKNVKMYSALKLANLFYKNKKYNKALWYYNLIVCSDIPDALKTQAVFNINNIKREYHDMEKEYTVNLLLPVYNALEDVKLCLASIIKYTNMEKVCIIILNDNSNAITTNFLRQFLEYENIYIIENESNIGYTKTINIGLKSATSKYIIMINSDTIVTEKWIEKMIALIETDETIGLVGPLSNAATWQTVPKLRDENNSFMVNELPNNYTVDSIQQLLDIHSLSLFPTVELLNGFCMMIRQDVITTIGYMDEISFPLGYGEETDYCIRAREAGYKLCIADNVYIYHSKSKSFGNEKRKQLSYYGEAAIKYKYGLEEYSLMKKHMNENEEINKIRNNLSKLLKEK